MFVNGNQLLAGKNGDQKSFWIVSDSISCEDAQMKTDGIVIQNSKVVSSICTAPGTRFLYFLDLLENTDSLTVSTCMTHAV